MEFQKLTLDHLGENESEDRRITLSPINIAVVAASTEDVSIRGRQARNVTVLFIDGASIDLTLRHSCLDLLETAIGTFCIG